MSYFSKAEIDTVRKKWIKAKLKECPLTYSFKDTVVISVYSSLKDSIYTYAESELELEHIFLANRKDLTSQFVHDSIDSMRYKIPFYDLVDKLELTAECGRTYAYNAFFEAFQRSISFQYLIQDLHIDNTYANKLLTKNVYANAYLNVYAKMAFDENSLAKYIIMTHTREKYKFKEVYKLYLYKDMLKKYLLGVSSADDLPKIPLSKCKSNSDVPIIEYTTDMINQLTKYFKADSNLGEFLSSYLEYYLWYAIPAFLELLYTIEHLNDIEAKETLKEVVCPMHNSFVALFTNDSQTEWCEDVLDYIREDKTSVRFEMLCNWVSGRKPLNGKIILEDPNLRLQPYFKDIRMYGLPKDIATLINYEIHLSETSIKIYLNAILLELLKEMKIPLSESFERLSRTDDFKEFMGSVDDVKDTKKEPKETVNTLFDIPKTNPLIGTPSGIKSKTTNATIDYLNNLVGSFSDDKYKFSVLSRIEKHSTVIDGTSSDTDKYNYIKGLVNLINKNLIKRIKDIKTYNTGGKNPGQSKGKIDRKAISKYKTTGKIFYNNDYKQKEMDLAFGIILDVSGSMAGSGIEKGIKTLIVLQETLQALNINFSIITHTSDGKYQSKIKKYHLFREDKAYTPIKNYNLVNITAETGNCDSGALYFMEKYISKVRNKDKIVIMFSDGQPTECTDTDLKNQVRHMEARGIHVIGIGINYPEIARYYPDFANGNSLKEMLDIVSNILERYVLEKKE